MDLQLDNLFLELSNFMRQWPSLVVSFLSIMLCDAAIIFARRYYGMLGVGCCMVVFNILGNIQVLYATAYEIINLPVLLGSVTLSASFLACDVINEHYGGKEAQRIVFFAFLGQLLFFLNIIMTLGHNPIDVSCFPNFSMTQNEVNRNISAIEQVFLPIPRLLVASYIAYLVSQLCEIWAYKATKHISFIKSSYIKHNISLFFSSVIVDTLTFTGIALVFLAKDPLSWRSFLDICLSACIIRLICNMINAIAMKTDIIRR